MLDVVARRIPGLPRDFSSRVPEHLAHHLVLTQGLRDLRQGEGPTAAGVNPLPGLAEREELLIGHVLAHGVEYLPLIGCERLGRTDALEEALSCQKAHGGLRSGVRADTRPAGRLRIEEDELVEVQGRHLEQRDLVTIERRVRVVEEAVLVPHRRSSPSDLRVRLSCPRRGGPTSLGSGPGPGKGHGRAIQAAGQPGLGLTERDTAVAGSWRYDWHTDWPNNSAVCPGRCCVR